MLNRITLMGRLTRDPEIRHTSNGTTVTSFTLAVERDFKDQSSGQKVTDFIDCVACRHVGEFVSRYFTKGRMAVVEGRLQVEAWKDANGNRRRSTKVVADSVYFGDSKNNKNASEGNAKESDFPQEPTQEFEEVNEDDGELPF